MWQMTGVKDRVSYKQENCTGQEIKGTLAHASCLVPSYYL